MAITYINRVTGATNNLVYLETSDSTATATAAGYITRQTPTITLLNDGVWTWETNDCIMLSASDGLSWCSINSTFTTIAAFSGVGAGDVTFTAPVVSGNLPSFSGTAGNIADSGIAATNVMTKNSVNQMAAGAAVLADKGIGTVTTGAVTINKQAGVITGTFTTAAAGTTTVTFNNSEIASTSVILVSLMGGTNAVPGVQLSCAYTSAGVATLTVTNNNVAGTALSGTLIIGFVVL